MNSREETNAVWQMIEGSQQLYKIYGYYPTFHDALVLRIETGFERKQITMMFRYCDFINDDIKHNVLTHITLTWQAVEKAHLCLSENDILHLEFTRKDDLIETIFEASFGFEGRIWAENVVVTNVLSEEQIVDSETETSSVKLLFTS